MSRYTTVLITGANRGIGLEFVKYYSQCTKRVIACCRSPENAAELQALDGLHDNLEIHTLDVSNSMHIAALKNAFYGQSIDLLINNAGIYGPKTSEAALDKALWHQVFEVNVMAPIQIATALIDNLSLSTNAVVANISSKMGSIADNNSGGATIYRSSKAALNAATKSYAIDHAALAINCVLLHPGWVQTDMGGKNALIDAHRSVKGMAKVLENLDITTDCNFFDYEGTSIPW